ncbi:MAG TPA: DUF6263 family protein [Gemmatimonadaceae bacterium]|nr:DUF6263 family protein [Gemmatimonadaceae bacterium]
MIPMVFRLAAVFVLSLVSISVQAQPVLLQVKPQVGDTLRVKLTQEVAMRGVPRGCGNQTTALRGQSKAPTANCADVRSMTTAMEVYSRAIARRASTSGTDILAITDSVVTKVPGPNQKRTKQPVPRGPVEIHVSADGTVEMGAGQASDDLRALFGQMPATLPKKKISPGEKWTHQMRVPLPDEPGATGLVNTTLQLDSLSRNGDIAYISMRGVLSHDHSDGSTSETSGSLTGTMQLDRRLGWITETHATIDVQAVVKNASTGQPMDVRTHVEQSLKVTGSR